MIDYSEFKAPCVVPVAVEGCPLCGGEAVVESYIVEASVSCLSCGVRVTRKHGRDCYEGIEPAIAAWNTRPPRQPAKDEAARYELEKDGYWWRLFLKHRENISKNVLMIGTDGELRSELLVAALSAKPEQD